MAHSMAKALGFSPGARKAPGVTVFTGTMLWHELKFGVAYMMPVTVPQRSAHASLIEVSLAPRWTIERSLPSRVAPRAIVCRVSARPPKAVKVCGLVTASLTGRPSILAAIAAIAPCGYTNALE